jgi:hypothetical protein
LLPIEPARGNTQEEGGREPVEKEKEECEPGKSKPMMLMIVEIRISLFQMSRGLYSGKGEELCGS